MDALQRSERARKAGLARWARLTPEQRAVQMRAAIVARHSIDTLVESMVRRAGELTPEHKAILRAAMSERR